MTEQMYVIAKMEDALTQPLVTKVELKKRLSAIVMSQQGWGPPDTWDEAIDVLLHGEKEQPIILSRAEPVSAEQPIKCSICGCDPLFAAGLRHYTDCPNHKGPNSKPTRKE